MAKTVLFGRYRLDEPLGAGGSAQVWRANDRKTGDTVAVKRLHPLVFADQAGRERLLREFRALRDLDEPHVVRVRDLELTDDEGALILDYVAGPSLAARLATEPRLSTAEAVAITLDVAAALAAAHRAGIVHRDVTPGNILLDPDDGARLTDFGIALGGAGTDAEPALTATGQLVGTLRYVAPEQLRGAPATPASDVHALAAVAYEMLAGKPAYEAATPVALAEAQARTVEPVRSIPPALDAAVRRALSPDPADRPADAAAFAADIEAAVAADRTKPIPVGAPAPSVTSELALPAPGAALAVDESLWDPVDEPAAADEPIPDGAGPLWGPQAAASAAPAASSVGPARPRSRLPVPAALALAILVIGFAIAALRPSVGQRPAATPDASQPVLVQSTPVVTPAPSADPQGDENGDGDKGKGKGEDKGGGKGKNGGD